MLEVTLAPGLLSRNYDGLQNDLEKMEGLFIARGSITDPVDFEAEWGGVHRRCARRATRCRPHRGWGEVKEQWVMHKIMVPFTMTGTIRSRAWAKAGTYKVKDTIAVVTRLRRGGSRDHDGAEVAG